jgi:hypothetical protein
MSAETIAINMLAERLSELEDRMDSLMGATKPTGSSDRLLTFSEALEAMRAGSVVRRTTWYPSLAVHLERSSLKHADGTGAKLFGEDITSDDWWIVKA